MDIKRISDNQVRCAITEKEIAEMGFDIDEIIGNTDETQKFMRVLLEKIEEQDVIDIGLLSPMVRAELLPDHSMNIIFGGITEEDKKNMFDKVLEMMERLNDRISAEALSAETLSEETSSEEAMSADVFNEYTPFALEFDSLDKIIRMSKQFFDKKEIPQSELYKMGENYYLLMDLGYVSKIKLRPFAFAAVEYNGRHIATDAGLAYIREHGKCIIKENAISSLMQL